MRWTPLKQRLTKVQAVYDTAPETVALWDLVPEERRKAFQDACRIMAMNVEYWLRQRLAMVYPYPDPRHERRLVRWLLHAGGTVHQYGAVLTITLEHRVRRGPVGSHQGRRSATSCRCSLPQTREFSREESSSQRGQH